MPSEIKDQTHLKESTQFNWMDALSGVGVLAGTAASIATQQITIAAAPLSVALLLQIFSRQQKVNALVEANLLLADAMASASSNLSITTEDFRQVSQGHQKQIDELTKVSQIQQKETLELKEMVDENEVCLAKHTWQLEAFDGILQSVKEISAVSTTEVQALSAEAHLIRGKHHEKLGHLEIAIEEYTQAIYQMDTYADAYLHRALAKAELGRNQSAVVDLNMATKYFFEEGDLKKYQIAKDMASRLHQGDDAFTFDLEKDTADEALELGSVSGLFD
ncbi:MAG: hypothetical protein HC810_00665 [Acaryochloridaceae cyanobacterium RL_2_7]|nr:hypothetical protein [Acaryochloridaceae cyanobacterium RL_2_7]